MEEKDLQYFLNQKHKYEVLAMSGYLLLGIAFVLFLPLGGSTPGMIPLLFGGFALGAIISGLAQSKFKKISNEFKKIYLTKEIHKIYPGSNFEVDKGFSPEEIYNSKVLRKQDRYYSEDLITGVYEGVPFETADVKLQDVRRSGKSTTVVTVFLGRVYKFQFNKRFKSNILINQPNFFEHLFGWNRVKTESVEFNNELTVYSDNEHEAFYILTPHFMEKLLQLDRKYHDKISFSFINNQLYIAINTNVDTFDIRLFRQFDASIIDEYRNQLNDIKDFIHHLNLDQTLFID